jgi:hypothetical protein
VGANGIVFSVRNDVCALFPFVVVFSMVVKKFRLCGLVHISSECLCPSKLHMYIPRLSYVIISAEGIR